jgi:drug/metabolite transporter (DMT)-like permease
MLAVFLALGAALGYAAASVLQQREAAAAPPHASGLRLVFGLARRPLWLAGLGCDWMAFALQAAALGVGQLIVVQPVITAGLLFALPVSAWLGGRRLGRRDLAAAVVLGAALSVFLLLAASGGGRDRAHLHAWLLCAAVAGPALAVCIAAASRSHGTRRAVLFALAAATIYGITAALTKTTVVLLDRNGLGFLGRWEPYGLVLLGGLGFVLNQRAFHAGSLSASLPTLTVVEPVVAAIIGLTMLDEHIAAHGGLQWFAVGLSVVAMALATVDLSLSTARADQPHDHELADVLASRVD